MPLSYCVDLVYIYMLYLLYRGVKLSNDVEADALVKLSMKRFDCRQIVTDSHSFADKSLQTHSYGRPNSMHLSTRCPTP